MNPLGYAKEPSGSIRPPWSFWLVPLVVVALRGIPFLLTRIATTLGGGVLPPVGYNPIDWFAYVGFIRQAAETGDWLLINPHTTMPQDGRFILPLFTLLGKWCHWSGADPFWALELARVPLVFIFFAVLWSFLAPLIPAVRQRLVATWLVGLSGGVEFLVASTLNHWPAKLRGTAVESLSDDQGWNTFAAMYNPLWVAGLTLTLVALRPLLKPTGTQRLGDWCQFVAGFIATYYVHPYSGLVVLGVAVLLPIVRWTLGVSGALLNYLTGAGVALLVSLAFIVPVALWQKQDAVYQLTAQGVFGDHQLSMFWYPVTLGGLGFFAVRGWCQWIRDSMPHRVEVGAWTVAVMFMHSSPLLNGFHFVFHLHIPLCIVAATALDEFLQHFRAAGWRGRIATALVVAVVFQSALAVTWRSAKQSLAYQIPAPIMKAILRLAQEPAGKVYTSPHIGTLIPAYTAHRVYVGHWFLTPDHAAKQAYFTALAEGRAPPGGLAELVQKEAIDYILLPPMMPRPVLDALRSVAKNIIDVDGFALIIMRGRQ